MVAVRGVGEEEADLRPPTGELPNVSWVKWSWGKEEPGQQIGPNATANFQSRDD